MSVWVDNLYMRSPVWLQQVAVAMWGVGWFRRRFGGRFRQYAQEFRERDYWTAEQFHAYQTARLSAILKAALRSLYYREIFERSGVSPDGDPWEALRCIPLLSKEALRQRARDLLTVDPLPLGTKVLKSSGTTGTPTEIFYSRDFHALIMAVSEARNLNVGGVTYRDRRVMFGVRKVCRFDQTRPPFWRHSPVERMAYASIYHLSPDFLPDYVSFLRVYRPAVVMGYPSALHTIARYAIERNDLPAKARCVVTTSETVWPQARRDIEAAFGCRLYDRYGAVEGCVFAGQCEHGRYHVSPETGIVEILDANGRACAPGVLGEVICTGLQNALQPLIRYRIGDAARWAVEQQCPCGRHAPILEAIEGRVEDMCTLPDGRRLLRFDTVFKGVGSIREAQVVQDGSARFRIRVVAAEGFEDRDEDLLKSNMRLHVGDAAVHVERVPRIERSPSGKFRAVVCKLTPEERRRLAAGAGESQIGHVPDPADCGRDRIPAK